MSVYDGKSHFRSLHVTVSLDRALPHCIVAVAIHRWVDLCSGYNRCCSSWGVDLGLEVPQDHFWAVLVLALKNRSCLHNRQREREREMERRDATDQLVVVELRSAVVYGEPPGGRAYRRSTDVAADRHVAEEEPVADERLPGAARRLVHDLQVGRVEAERGRRQPVGDQVHPEQLDRDQSFGHAERRRQEDADHLHSAHSTPSHAARAISLLVTGADLSLLGRIT